MTLFSQVPLIHYVVNHAREGMNDTSVRGAVQALIICSVAYDANTNDLRPDIAGNKEHQH